MHPSNRNHLPLSALVAAAALFCTPARAGFSATGSIGNLTFTSVDLVSGAPGVAGSSYSFVDTAGGYPSYFVDVAPSAAQAWGANYKDGAGSLPAGGAQMLSNGFVASTSIPGVSSTVTTTSTSLSVQVAGSGGDGLRVGGAAAHFGTSYPTVVVTLAAHTSLTIGFDLSMQLHQDGLCNAGQCDAAFALVQVSIDYTPGSQGWLDGSYATLTGPGGGGLSASNYAAEPYASFNATSLADYSISEHHQFVLTNPFDTTASYNLYGSVDASGLAVASVPEPGTWLLWAAALPLLAWRRRALT